MRTLGPICALLTLAALAGCSGGSKEPVASPSSISPTPSTSATTPESSSPSPTVTPSQLTTPSSAPVAAAPTCDSSSLQVSLGPQGAAARTLYQTLVFTNTGTAACSTRGYPGVSFLDANGDQLGKPARRDTAEKPHRVTLSPGEKAHVVVGMPQATACEEADSRGIRVYPPGQTDSLHVQWHQTVCTNDEARSSVGPVQPGKTS